MTWSALIPGLREIRGPLVAGYLWMAAIWLALGDFLPSRASGEAFERLWDLGYALGPIGLLAIASLFAYLIGSLVHTLFSAAAGRARGRGLRWNSPVYGVPEDRSDESWISVAALADPEAHDAGRYFEIPFADVTAAGSLFRLEGAELSEVRDNLQGAVRHALQVTGGQAKYKLLGWRGRAPVIGIPRPDRDLAELMIPQFAPFEDLWRNRSLLETRLREQAPATASKIERIDAEADFREAAAPPLVALIAVFAVQASPFWLALLAFPAALLIQARFLRRSGGRELADSLRARSGTPELEQITPVFARYRVDADRLAEALIGANWKDLGYLEHLVDELPRST